MEAFFGFWAFLLGYYQAFCWLFGGQEDVGGVTR